MKPGRKPYGTFPGELEILRFVAERRAAHDTWRRIAELLNQVRLLKRNGKPWSAPELFAIAQKDPIKE